MNAPAKRPRGRPVTVGKGRRILVTLKESHIKRALELDGREQTRPTIAGGIRRALDQV